MSDLISRSELIRVLKDRATNESIAGYMTAYDVTNSIIDDVEEQPTAYDINKVVEELEKAKTINVDVGFGTIYKTIRKDVVLEIVKQGCVSNNRKDCEYRHENGNCLKVGGFCTSVNDKHCEKMKQGSVSDDVCEWKKVDEEGYQNCKCNYDETIPDFFKYCPYCSKKIKVGNTVGRDCQV